MNADLGTLTSSHQRYEAAGLQGDRQAVTAIRLNPNLRSVVLKTECFYASMGSQKSNFLLFLTCQTPGWMSFCRNECSNDISDRRFWDIRDWRIYVGFRLTSHVWMTNNLGLQTDDMQAPTLYTEIKTWHFTEIKHQVMNWFSFFNSKMHHCHD